MNLFATLLLICCTFTLICASLRRASLFIRYLVTFFMFFLVFFVCLFFSSKRSSGDSPGWNHALCHSAGLRMSSSCRQRHGEEGECQAVMLEIERINLAPWMISCWLCCRGFVHGKGPDCKRKENTAGWSDTSHRDVCSCFASVIGKGEWFRVLRVHYFIRFNIHEISLTAFPFVFVVLRWYW